MCIYLLQIIHWLMQSVSNMKTLCFHANTIQSQIVWNVKGNT